MTVKLRVGGATGIIETIDKNRATLLVGDLRMTAKLRDLEKANEQMEVRRTKSISSDVQRVSAFDSKLDVRGMRFEEVLATTEAFVDQALMANASTLRIVHGKGTGALKRAVQQKIREYRGNLKMSHPPKEAGGDGVTVVEL
jgi:DNA mismatch repair protein MutS2